MDQTISRQQRRHRERKGTITAGFTPVANKKVTGMFQAILASFVKANEKRVVPLTGMQIQEQAYAELRRRLPQPPIGTRTASLVKPSKSDDPAYRRGGNFDKATGQPINQLAEAA
jgi:hypothetical protein